MSDIFRRPSRRLYRQRHFRQGRHLRHVDVSDNNPRLKDPQSERAISALPTTVSHLSAADNRVARVRTALPFRKHLFIGMFMSEVVAIEARASLLKFGDYCVAGPGERRRIISNQKYPPEFITTRYTKAENALAAHLCGSLSARDLAARRDAILASPRIKPQDEERNISCAEAIDAALAFIPTSRLAAMTMVLLHPRPPHLLHRGVSISVQPDLLIECPASGRSPAHRGLFKFRFGKTQPMDAQAARLAAAILHRYGRAFLDDEPPVDHRVCMIYDVFHNVIHTATGALVRTWATIDAACTEYATMWEVA